MVRGRTIFGLGRMRKRLTIFMAVVAMLFTMSGVQATALRGSVSDNVNFVDIAADPSSNQLVAIGILNGTDGYIARSSDGVTWQSIEGIPTGSKFNSITFSNGMFVAVGNKIAVSTDGGQTWTYSDPPTNEEYIGVSYAFDEIYIMSPSYVYTSANPLDSSLWVRYRDIIDQTFGEFRYKAMTRDEVSIRFYSGNTQYDEVEEIRYNNTRHGYQVYWPDTTSVCHDMTCVVGARDYIDSNNHFIYTYNLLDYAYDEFSYKGYPIDVPLSDVTYAQGKFVGIDKGNKLYWSSDAKTWQSRQLSANSTLRSMIYVNGIFYAVGDQHSVVRFAVSPAISSQPENWEGLSGSNASFTVEALGQEVSLQWQVDTGSGTFGNIVDNEQYSGATSSTLSITGVTSEMNGYQYRVIATGSEQPAATSNAATLTVQDPVDAATPAIDTPPMDQSIYKGDSAQLSVTATVNDGGILSYQWYSHTVNSNRDGTLIDGATSASYDAPTATVGTTYYYVVVTNTNSSATGNQSVTAVSNPAKVTVMEAPAVNSVTVSPGSASIVQGESLQLTATVQVVGGAAQTVTWWSSNPKVVVDNTGRVTVAADAVPGEYSITAMSTVDTSKSGTATIKVTSAAPPNSIPVAQNDYYNTHLNKLLTIQAPGLLENDEDLETQDLMVSMEEPAANGEVTVEPTGAFTYQPHEGFRGLDQFTYRVYDGVDYSEPATVSLYVYDALSVDQVKGKPGDVVTVPVRLTSTGNVAGLQFDLSFDDTYLTLQSIEAGELLTGADTVQDDVYGGSFDYETRSDRVRVVIANVGNVPIGGEAGVLVNVKFLVEESAYSLEDGDKVDLNLSKYVMTDHQGQELTRQFTNVNGWVQFEIDKIAPKISYSFTPDPSERKVKVYVNADGTGSPVTKLLVMKGWVDEPAAFPVSGEDTLDILEDSFFYIEENTTYTVYAEDAAGNTSIQRIHVMGDADFTKVVDVTDWVAVINYILERVTPTEAQKMVVDMNRDDELTVVDPVIMANVIMAGGYEPYYNSLQK